MSKSKHMELSKPVLWVLGALIVLGLIWVLNSGGLLSSVKTQVFSDPVDYAEGDVSEIKQMSTFLEPIYDLNLKPDVTSCFFRKKGETMWTCSDALTATECKKVSDAGGDAHYVTPSLGCDIYNAGVVSGPITDITDNGQAAGQCNDIIVYLGGFKACDAKLLTAIKDNTHKGKILCPSPLKPLYLAGSFPLSKNTLNNVCTVECRALYKCVLPS